MSLLARDRSRSPDKKGKGKAKAKVRGQQHVALPPGLCCLVAGSVASLKIFVKPGRCKNFTINVEANDTVDDVN